MLFSRNKKNFYDERIEQEKNKIYREIYYLVIGLCVLSVIVKFFMFEWGTAPIYTELLILVGIPIYYVVRSAKTGIFSEEIEVHDGESKWSFDGKMAGAAIIGGVAISIVMAINSVVQFAQGPGEAWYYFILVFITSMMIYTGIIGGIVLLSYLYLKNKSQKVAESTKDE
ncbi:MULTISPECIES: DUF6773 family protein [Shouchella]|uniref:DUF3278 domain-containing protein n=1 Tax=Shouchella clausii TaxID=79880 RepID=A0A268S127_SHOCL|nr:MULTISPECIES: DUF6773 family protein [Shouchella]PAD44456.1 hypothetical protein CHH54_02280 [Bacillus sp. 7520-S]SPT79361.1 Uncharacterised protein [Niallia circulans]MBU8596136.1 hypothetical protein [Shouchella clausii]MCM3549173.1 hypothetical protein [Shouchella clausii]MCY1102920.1 hypothetical protein [Shouchella clausii]